MLRDEVALYTELSGKDGEHTPIGIIGAYLDGYNKALEDKDKIQSKLIDKVIHSIAEQYSKHNTLVPYWLEIGDIRIEEAENE